MNDQFVPSVCDSPHDLESAESVMIGLISGKFCIYCVIYFHRSILNLIHHAFSF